MNPFSIARGPRAPSNRQKRGLSATLSLLIGLYGFLLGGRALAEGIELNPDHPDRYVVVRGDTLWDIAGRFLARPWQWPEIWHNNPGIENPDLIYPGDEIVFRIVDGKPRLEIGTPAIGTPAEGRLSPRIRISPMEQAIPTIPLNAVRQFLTRPRIVSSTEMQEAPYILTFAGDHVVGGMGDRMYVRGIENDTRDAYTVFRAGPPYRDADSGEVLGYEAIYVGDTQLERTGNPATLLLSRSDREARIGDRLLPVEQERIATAFQPHAPSALIQGRIIGVLDGVSQIGLYNVVVIDKGTRDGIEIGHVFDIYQTTRPVRDIVQQGFGQVVALPDEKAGVLMVFRPFERASYALVMKASRALHVLDKLLPP